MLVLLPLPILFFPDGKISRGWRWTLWAYIALVAVLVGHLTVADLGAFTEHPVRIDSSGELQTLGGSGNGAGFAVVALLFFAISLSWVVRQVVRYRRSSGDRRQQLKWLLVGGSFAVFGFLLAITIGSGNRGAVNPLRGRIQRLVDRRFDRARYDADALVAAFGARLRDAVEPETVVGELSAAAAGSLHPAHVSTWVRPAE